jgi:hypothetical protein
VLKVVGCYGKVPCLVALSLAVFGTVLTELYGHYRTGRLDPIFWPQPSYIRLLVGPASLIPNLGAPEKADGREFRGLLG